MQNEPTSKQEWLNYISKLNERSISRRSASGFTSWAILGLLCYLILKAINKIPDINGSSHAIRTHIITLSSAFNLGIGFIFFSMSLLGLAIVSENKIRINPTTYKSTISQIAIPLFCLFIPFGYLNAVAANIAPTFGLPKWPFWFMTYWIAANIATPVLSKIKHIIKCWKSGDELPDIATPPIMDTFPFKVFMFSFFSFVLVTQLIPTFYAWPKITRPEHISIIVWGIQSAGIVFLIAAFFVIQASRARESFLLSLEQEIILDNLEPEEIKSRFIKALLGPTLQDWFQACEKKLSDLREECDAAFEKANQIMADVSKIDPNMTYQIDGMRKEACELCQRKLEAYTDYSNKFLDGIQHLAQRKAFLHDVKMFEEFRTNYKSYSKTIMAKHEQVCRNCRNATNCEQKITPLNSETIQAVLPPPTTA